MRALVMHEASGFLAELDLDAPPCPSPPHAVPATWEAQAAGRTAEESPVHQSPSGQSTQALASMASGLDRLVLSSRPSLSLLVDVTLRIEGSLADLQRVGGASLCVAHALVLGPIQFKVARDGGALAHREGVG